MPRSELAREVEKELTGRDSEPSELIYFKVYNSQAPVIEQAIDTAALMLGSDKSRGYCQVCPDFCVTGQVLFLGWGAGEGCTFPCPSM